MISQICQIIKDNIDIVDFCSDYYNCSFIASTKNWYNTNCLMPNHQDNSPSFGVNSETNTFKCFGCSAQGSIIDLVMQVENYNLKQATDFLLSYLDIQPEITSKNFYSLHKLLSNNKAKELDKDLLMDAKIKVVKKFKNTIDFDQYYNEIINLFDQYERLDAEEFKKFIYEN